MFINYKFNNGTQAPSANRGPNNFQGSGTNDGVFTGSYTGSTDNQTIFVKIDGTGTPDTFSWYIEDTTQGGTPTPTSTAVQTGVSITGGAQVLGSTGILVTFSSTTGHTSGDYWYVDVQNYISGDFRFDNASMAHVTKFYMSDESRQI